MSTLSHTFGNLAIPFGPDRVPAATDLTYPLRFEPVYKDYLWGGNRFATLFGRNLPADSVMAESWEIADHPHGESIVAEGPCRGMSLRRLMQTSPEGLLGTNSPWEPGLVSHRPPLSANIGSPAGMKCFPLMLKYLDANQPLSVQVHPSDATALEMGLADPGKTEAWVVLDAKPGAALRLGFEGHPTRREVERAIADGSLVELLHRVEPEVGDCFLIEAGTVHVLGEGILVAEVQQSSDTTFRLFDWNRKGPDGRMRPLHIEQGCESIDYARGPVNRCEPRPTDDPTRELLAESEYFNLFRWSVHEPRCWKPDGACHLWTLLDGILEVSFTRREKYAAASPTGRAMSECFGIVAEEKFLLRRGESLLMPARCDSVSCTPLSPKARLLDAQVRVAGC